jgi:hypothetical protein
LNSTSLNAEQPKICSNSNTKYQTQNMETPNYNPDIIFDEELYTIEWSDIENAVMNYDDNLNDIENFFREDFENDTLEEDIY